MSAKERLAHTTPNMPFSSPEMMVLAADYSEDLSKPTSEERLNKIFSVRNGNASTVNFPSKDKEEAKQHHDAIAKQFGLTEPPPSKHKSRDASPVRKSKSPERKPVAEKASPAKKPIEEVSEDEKENKDAESEEESESDSSELDPDKMDVDEARSEDELEEEKQESVSAGKSNLEKISEEESEEFSEEEKAMLAVAEDDSSDLDSSLVVNDEPEEKAGDESDSLSDDNDSDAELLEQVGSQIASSRDESSSEDALVASEASEDDRMDVDQDGILSDDDDEDEDSDSSEIAVPARDRPARQRKATQYYNDNDFVDDDEEAEEVGRKPKKRIVEIKPSTAKTDFETPIEAARSLPPTSKKVTLEPSGRRIDLRTIPTMESYDIRNMSKKPVHSALVQCIKWCMWTAITNEMHKRRMKFEIKTDFEQGMFLDKLQERIAELVVGWRRQLKTMDEESPEHFTTRVRIAMASYTVWTFCDEKERPGYVKITLRAPAIWAEGTVADVYYIFVRKVDIKPFILARIACYPEQHFYLRTRRAFLREEQRRQEKNRKLPPKPDSFFVYLSEGVPSHGSKPAQRSEFIPRLIQVWRYACWASGIEPFPLWDF